MRRSAIPFLLLCAAPLAAREPAQNAPAAEVETAERGFARPNVPAALFTHEKIALVEPECERIASFLARHAAQQYTAAVLRGNAEARSRGRLLLTVSLHLQLLNASAIHCAQRWADGKVPTLPPPDENLRLFSNFLLSAARRQADKPGPARDALARILIRLAADLDPENEDAVLASELQDRDGHAPPLRELLEGTLGKDWR